MLTRDMIFDPNKGYSPSNHEPIISDDILEVLQVLELKVDCPEEQIQIQDFQVEFDGLEAGSSSQSNILQHTKSS